MRQQRKPMGQWLESLLVVVVGVWGSGAMAFHLPGWGGKAVILVWLLAMSGLLLAIWRGNARQHAQAGVVFLLGLLLVSLGWSRIVPLQDRDWADDVARRLQVVSFDGRHVVLDNVRNFRWRTPEAYEIAWERRQYDLDQLRSADVLLSYWMGPLIAHTLVSFGFADGQQLVFSLEIRKESHEQFDSLAGFFRRYEVTLVAADERDIVATRTNARGEDVYLYRVSGLEQPALRELFQAYLAQAQALDAAPAFYNTLTSNCTTIVWELARQVAPGLPLDWRLLASGYFAEYVHDNGGLEPGVSMTQLRQAGRITERARAAGDGPGFSTTIRAGIPGTAQGVEQ